MKFKDFLLECVKLVEKVDERHILAGMGELLNKKTKSWAKKNLKKRFVILIETAIRKFIKIVDTSLFLHYI